MRLFDTKFGRDFLAAVPSAPGVYRFYDGPGALLYVGKAANLRDRKSTRLNSSHSAKSRMPSSA